MVPRLYALVWLPQLLLGWWIIRSSEATLCVAGMLLILAAALVSVGGLLGIACALERYRPLRLRPTGLVRKCAPELLSLRALWSNGCWWMLHRAATFCVLVLPLSLVRHRPAAVAAMLLLHLVVAAVASFSRDGSGGVDDAQRRARQTALSMVYTAFQFAIFGWGIVRYGPETAFVSFLLWNAAVLSVMIFLVDGIRRWLLQQRQEARCKPDPAPVCGNRRSMRYHDRDCADISGIREHHLRRFESAEAARALGYVAANHCCLWTKLVRQ